MYLLSSKYKGYSKIRDEITEREIDKSPFIEEDFKMPLRKWQNTQGENE